MTIPAGRLAGGVTGRWYRKLLRLLAVAVAILAVGNGAIVAAHLWLERPAPRAAVDMAVPNFAVVDDRVWRGAAPAPQDYEALAEHGVATVVDLRAERGIRVDEAELTRLGITRVHLPVRDGQAPTTQQVKQFLEVVAASPGRVYVHCGAGVGRTGTMAAAYAVVDGDAAASEAVTANLRVGPPSLEQLAFAAGLERGLVPRPPSAVVALSRTLDAPRRLWVHVRRAYV